MKIAFMLITSGLVYRGAEMGTQMLAEDLTKRGHQITYIQSGKETGKEKYHVKHISSPLSPNTGVPKTIIGKVFERIYLNKKGLLILLFSLRSLPFLIREKYDILFPVDGFWQVLICKIAQFISGGKVVVSGKSGGWIDRHALMLKPDIFIPISAPAADWAKSINPKQKVVFVPEQVDLTIFKPGIRPIKTNLKKPVILTIAAFSKYKRIDTVIKAVSKLKNVSLLIVGHGEKEAEIRSLADKLLPGRCKIKKASYDQLPAIYNSADVFTLASESQEAFGRVLVEALACGLPVVTTDDPVRRSIIGDIGLYIDPKDAKEYAKALGQSLKSTGKKELYRRQATKYDRNKTVIMYEQAFVSVLSKS